MGIFGDDDSQDARLDQLEWHVRRLVEEVQQLSIDLGVTRTELLRARIDLGGAVRKGDVDPSIVALNEAAGESRKHVDAARSASEDRWGELRQRADESLDQLRAQIDEAFSGRDGSGSRETG